MSSLDSLPGDQRAVLQLVLGRGRSYDEIARLLSIKPSAVRERAQIALDAIGPHTDVAPEQQQRVADYLLGQLSAADAQEARDLLADSPSARAWARVVASELSPLAGENPMPEITVERSAPSEPVAAPPRAAEPAASAASAAAETGEPPISGQDPAQSEAEKKGRRRRRRRDEADEAPVGAPRSSRVGGALVILAVIVAVGAGLFFVLRGGHSKRHGSSISTTTAAPAASATTPTTATTSSTSSSGTSASVVAQINLTPPPTAKNSKAAGIAEVLNEGSTDGVAIVAQNVPPNTTKPPNAYAVWLYNSPKDAKILGFVNPGVGKTGRLSTAGGLPSNASHYKQLVVTVETTASPKTPGTIILQGNLTRL
ncbi:MAG: RNA polymerase sigma factor [Solirubrobacteraceae bacterium]